MNFINGKIELSDKLYFVIDKVNVKIKLDEKYSKKLHKYRDKEITFGISQKIFCSAMKIF
jgi:hypothetical protein